MDNQISPYKTVHATALVIGEMGVLVRGKSGSGKTALALKLIGEARKNGMFARLVSDDRVRLFATHLHLVATPHPEIKGKIEIRGIGVIPIEYEKSCILKLVIDLAEIPLRMPDTTDEMTEISGLKLRCINMMSRKSSICGILHFLKNFDFKYI